MLPFCMFPPSHEGSTSLGPPLSWVGDITVALPPWLNGGGWEKLLLQAVLAWYLLKGSSHLKAW